MSLEREIDDAHSDRDEANLRNDGLRPFLKCKPDFRREGVGIFIGEDTPI